MLAGFVACAVTRGLRHDIQFSSSSISNEIVCGADGGAAWVLEGGGVVTGGQQVYLASSNDTSLRIEPRLIGKGIARSQCAWSKDIHPDIQHGFVQKLVTGRPLVYRPWSNLVNPILPQDFFRNSLLQGSRCIALQAVLKQLQWHCCASTDSTLC